MRAQLIREIDEQDRVLGDQADEQHHPDHREDVEAGAGEQKQREAADHRKRLGEHDHQRLPERVELAREHDVNERQREQKGELHVSGGGLELPRLADQADLVARRQGLGGDREEALDRHLERHRRVHIEQGGIAQLEALDHRRPQDFGAAARGHPSARIRRRARAAR